MTSMNGFSNRSIPDELYDSFEALLSDTPIELQLGEKYPLFICGNTYRKVKDRHGNWIKNVEEVFSEIIFYLMKKGYPDTVVYLFMEESCIGLRKKKGYAWQCLPEDQKWRIITFNRMLYKDYLKEEEEKRKEIDPPFWREEDNKDKLPELPATHPLNNPYLLAKVHSDLGKRIVDEKRNRLIVFLVLCSAYLIERPLGCAGLGKSSVGKSMVFDTVIKHFPEKRPDQKSKYNTGWFLCNNITEAALFRLNKEFADHTIFYLGEMPDTMTETQKELFAYLRQLQSEGRISKTLSEQIMKENGKIDWIAKSYHLEANISHLASSIFEFEEQFGNRQIKLSFDESEEQTNRIADWKAEIQTFGTEREDIAERMSKSKFIVELIEGLDQWYYKQYEELDYQNPYAKYVINILKKIYSGSVQLRRVVDYVFRFIEVITRLHVRHRKIGFSKTGKGKPKIIATGEDNLIGLWLLWHSLEQAIFSLTVSDKEILNLMKQALKEEDKVELVPNKDWEYGKWFTTNKMAKAISKGRKTVREAIRRLERVGYLKAAKGNKAGSWFKYSILEKPEIIDSIVQSDWLPFFLPIDTETSGGLGGVYRNSGGWHPFPILRMPVLEAIFSSNFLRYCTARAYVLGTVLYLYRGKIEINKLNKENPEDLLLYLELKNYLNSSKGMGTPPPSSGNPVLPPELGQVIDSTWFRQLILLDCPVESGNLDKKAKQDAQLLEKLPQLDLKLPLIDRIEKIILSYNLDNEVGIPTLKILEKINSTKKNKLTEEKLKEILDSMMEEGIIYEPMPDLWKHIESA